jgi:PAS domain S-box-containing protein
VESPLLQIIHSTGEFICNSGRLLRAYMRPTKLPAQFALIVEQMPIPIAIYDADMRYLAVSRRYLSDMESLYSVRPPSPSEIIGCSVYEVFPDILRWREVHARVLAGEELTQHEEFVPFEDGSTAYMRRSLKPWRTANGQIGGALLFMELITEQVAARRALAESEARFRATFENAAVGIAHVSSDLRFIRANQALCRILGWPMDEFLSKSLCDISHPDDLAVDLAYVEQVRAGKIDSYDMDKRYLRKDGTTVWGRLTVGCVRGSDGSVDYFVAVIEDITGRKLAEEELAKSEERFRTSILHSPVPTALWDDREQILALSQSWLTAGGFSSAAELHRVEDWTIRAHGEHSGEALEVVRDMIATEPVARTDERILTLGGEKRIWNYVTSGLGTLSDGRRLFVTVAQDLTDRKAYEERIEMLMREARHRTKNILGLVQAIARQTATGEAQDFIGRFSERIRALAANQDLLVQHAWQRIDVKDLVQIQLGHFADLIGTRINFDGPKLPLNAAAAQAIGLALHELATNAGKYGALSTDAGRVDVSWQLEDDTFMMGWTERGGPPARPPERRGFGSTVIESMVKQSLGGAVQLDYAPSGLEWHLTCRAADALEGGGDSLAPT